MRLLSVLKLGFFTLFLIGQQLWSTEAIPQDPNEERKQICKSQLEEIWAPCHPQATSRSIERYAQFLTYVYDRQLQRNIQF